MKARCNHFPFFEVRGIGPCPAMDYKPTETFQYTHFTSCHPPGVKRGFIKGEAIRLLRTNSSKTTFEECLTNFKRSLEARGYPKDYIERSLSEVNFDSIQSALKPQKQKNAERILPFVTKYCQPARLTQEYTYSKLPLFHREVQGYQQLQQSGEPGCGFPPRRPG